MRTQATEGAKRPYSDERDHNVPHGFGHKGTERAEETPASTAAAAQAATALSEHRSIEDRADALQRIVSSSHDVRTEPIYTPD